MSRLTFTLFLVFCALTAPGAEPPCILLENTTSPDGRYAFGWGLPPKFRIDWDALRRGEAGGIPKDFEFADDVENYLVDLRGRKILATLRAARVWRLPGGSHSNHRDLEVCWSPESDRAVAIYSRKWGYESFEAFYVAAGKVAASLEIGTPLEKAWRADLAATCGARYRRKKERLVVSFGALEAESGGRFSALAHAEIPKSLDDEDQFDERRIRFALVPKGRSALLLKILGTSKAEPSDSLEQRLAADDRQLNDLYAHLRAALPEKERETLRDAQRAWLQRRDRIDFSEERARFVERRVMELQARLRSLTAGQLRE